MSRPLVTVVIPCFNVAGTVAETIASVTAQTVSDFEIVAVDNNCTDTTTAVLKDIMTREPRLRIVEQPVQGLSAARNGGIKAAAGKFIAFLDADDLWDRDYLESHLHNLADDTIGVSYSRIRLIDNAGKPTGQVTEPQLSGLTAVNLLRTNPCTSLIVVRRDVFDRVGFFDEALRSVEDQEWLFRAAAGGIRLEGIDRPLASYRITPGSLSSDLSTMLRSHDQLLEAAARVEPELTKQYRRMARGAMLRYCARRAVEHNIGSQVARHYLRKSLSVAPDLLLREPEATLKTIALVLVPWVKKLRPANLRAETA